MMEYRATIFDGADPIVTGTSEISPEIAMEIATDRMVRWFWLRQGELDGPFVKTIHEARAFVESDLADGNLVMCVG